MKKIIVLFSLIILSLTVWGQMGDSPLHWKFSLQDKGNGEVELTANVTIESGWHMYGLVIPDGIPYPTEITIDEIKGAEAIGKLEAVDSKLIEGFDPIFEKNIGYYENKAKFIQRIKIVDKSTFVLNGDFRAQACNDESCTPPLPVSYSFTAKDIPASVVVPTVASNVLAATNDKKEDIAKNDVTTEPKIDADDAEVVTPVQEAKESVVGDLWKPVIKEIQNFGVAGGIDDSTSLIWMFIFGMGGGLLALLTPCVWPLIPMTVSFFLKRNKKNKAKALKDALTYGLGIIVIYVGLGLIVTALFGASALNDLSTNAIFNIAFGLLLIFFAASFFGAFEIVLPASWANKIDSKAESTTGIISIFSMASTLAIVSFSCTGPVIGTVLVQAANSGEFLAPAIVMFGFALALAIPFSLFAMFPSWLSSLPKSGGWLNSVKVVLGFLELALALKFFSVADMAYGWRLLDREVFLVLWIIIFALLGLYLLGKIRFKHDEVVEKLSVSRFFLAIVPLAFALYLVPGLWGAPLRSISAFSPPLTTQDLNLYDGAVHAQFDDYELGMAYAKKVNKPVLLDFSGWGCVNCRKMEANVWTNPQVKNIIENDYVLITLMVDDKSKLPEVVTVDENGRETKLKTIGDKWSYFQRHKFGTNSQPYYVLLNTEGQPIAPSYAYNEDIQEYLKFLNTGLKNFKK